MSATPQTQEPRNLQTAKLEILQLLDRHDIAGIVVLHAPGQTDYFVKIDPSYSCADFEEGNVRFSAFAADFGGDAQARNQAMAATADMFTRLVETTASIVVPLLEVSDAINRMGQVDEQK